MLGSWQVTDGVFSRVTFQGDFCKGAKHKGEQGERKPQRVSGTVCWVNNSEAASMPEPEGGGVALNPPTWRLYAEHATFSVWLKFK